MGHDMVHKGLEVTQFRMYPFIDHSVIHIPVEVNKKVAQPRQFPHSASEIIRQDAGLIQHLEAVFVILWRPQSLCGNDVVRDIDTGLDRNLPIDLGSLVNSS